MKRIISLSNVIEATLGVIYRMAPGHKPRKVDKIVDYIKGYFENEVTKFDDYFAPGDGYISFRIDEDKIFNFLKEMLFACPEFEELNLSQDEFDRGVKVDDEDRPMFNFVSRDTYTPEYYDFIDLDACVNNVYRQMNMYFLDDDIFEDKVVVIDKDNPKEEYNDVDRFRNIVVGMLSLYQKKNANYGNSFEKLYNELGPIAGIVPLHNKLDRLTNLVKGGHNDFESLEDTLVDLANYAIMNVIELKKKDAQERPEEHKIYDLPITPEDCADHCVVCGKYVPEGRQVCDCCENGIKEEKE